MPRTISLSSTTGRVKKCFPEFCYKKTWRWLANQDLAKLVCTDAIDRTTFHACLRCRKTALFAVFSRLRGVIWRGKAFRDQQCQFLTRNKRLRSENESNCSMTFECVHTDSILPRGAGLEHGRCKQSFSRFQFSVFGRTAKFLAPSFLLRFCYGFFYCLCL